MLYPQAADVVEHMLVLLISFPLWKLPHSLPEPSRLTSDGSPQACARNDAPCGVALFRPLKVTWVPRSLPRGGWDHCGWCSRPR